MRNPEAALYTSDNLWRQKAMDVSRNNLFISVSESMLNYERVMFAVEVATEVYEKQNDKLDINPVECLP